MMQKLDVDFDKLNICSLCIGEGGFSYYHEIKKEQVTQPCICGDGSRVGELKFELEIEKSQRKRYIKELVELRTWVMLTSTCKTCGGNQDNTPGWTNCKECGLPGNQPWPG